LEEQSMTDTYLSNEQIDVPIADVPIADVPIADVPIADVPIADVPIAEAGLAGLLASPQDGGRVELVIVRPAEDERRSLPAAHLSPEGGLEGDRWAGEGRGAPDPQQQVSLTNARLLRILAGSEERMPLAGDNLVVDLDLSDENLPPGQKLQVGEVLLEMTAAPHTGCGKFSARFGPDAARFVNDAARRTLHLRGRYARILQAGTIRVGDRAFKID
jgi:MOSC domain-containing protein YiiM